MEGVRGEPSRVEENDRVSWRPTVGEVGPYFVFTAVGRGGGEGNGHA